MKRPELFLFLCSFSVPLDLQEFDWSKAGWRRRRRTRLKGEEGLQIYSQPLRVVGVDWPCFKRLRTPQIGAGARSATAVKPKPLRLPENAEIFFSATSGKGCWGAASPGFRRQGTHGSNLHPGCYGWVSTVSCIHWIQSGIMAFNLSKVHYISLRDKDRYYHYFCCCFIQILAPELFSSYVLYWFKSINNNR